MPDELEQDGSETVNRYKGFLADALDSLLASLISYDLTSTQDTFIPRRITK